MSTRKNNAAGMGARIRKRREAKGLTQEQLAEAVSKESGESLTKSAVAKWEEGVSLPRARLVPGIARVLDTDVGHLYGEKKAA